MCEKFILCITETKHEYIRIILLAYDISNSVAIHFDETVLYYHLYIKIEKITQWSHDPDIMTIPYIANCSRWKSFADGQGTSNSLENFRGSFTLVKMCSPA